MNIPKLNSNREYNQNFNGRVFVYDGYITKKLKQIAKQVNKMKIVKNSDTNIKLAQPLWNVEVKVPTAKRSAAITTVADCEAITSAFKRVLAKHNQEKKIANAKKTVTSANNTQSPQSENIFQKIKKVFNKLIQKVQS